MNNFQDFIPKQIQQDVVDFNRQLTSHLTSSISLVQDIRDYVLQSGGKRIRPLLVLLIAKGFGYVGDQRLKLACIVEYIHTATLLHDDILDAASFRRSLPTVNKKWGNAPAVLVGDYFYTQAFMLIANLNHPVITQAFAKANALIIDGELLQLTQVANTNLSPLSYFRTIYRKTAVLFAVAARAMAILAGQPLEQQRTIVNYARCLGMAFQLVDDWLDYAGEEKHTGKQPGRDLAEKKLTLPLIYALREANSSETQWLKQAIMQQDNQDSNVRFNQVKHIVQETGALTYTKACAGYYAERAIWFLKQTDLDADAVLHLHRIAKQLTERAR